MILSGLLFGIGEGGNKIRVEEKRKDLHETNGKNTTQGNTLLEGHVQTPQVRHGKDAKDEIGDDDDPAASLRQRDDAEAPRVKYQVQIPAGRDGRALKDVDHHDGKGGGGRHHGRGYHDVSKQPVGSKHAE